MSDGQLSKVNGELICIRGVQVYGLDWSQNRKWGCPTRFSLVMKCEHGAIELWEEAYPEETVKMFQAYYDKGMRFSLPTTHFGGVLVHLPSEVKDTLMHHSENCHILDSRHCYSQGSSLDYDEMFYPLLHTDGPIDSERVLQLLAICFQTNMNCEHADV